MTVFAACSDRSLEGRSLEFVMVSPSLPFFLINSVILLLLVMN